MVVSRNVTIGDILKRIRRPVAIEDGIEYQLVTIKLHHKGVVERCRKMGDDIGSKKMYRVHTGDFILSGIDARNGAFGIVPPELDGAVVTNDFWYCEVDESLIDKRLFLELTHTAWFDHICRLGSDGTTQRIRLQKDKFFNQEVTLPAPSEQKPILKLLLAFKATQLKLSGEINGQRKLLQEYRQKVLQEAIEGKLTADWREANPDVEPASELLTRIAAEKAELVKAKKTRKPKPLLPITDEDMLYDIHESWSWCRLGDVSHVFAGHSFKSEEFNTSSGVRCIKITNAGVQHLIATEDYLPSSFLATYPDFVVKQGDLVIALTRPYIAEGLKISICPELYDNSLLNQRVAVIRPLANQSYVYLYLTTNHVLQRYKAKFKKANLQPNLKMTDITELPLPLPPAGEQRAIAERIQAKFALCDQLELEIAATERQTEYLSTSILQEVFDHNHSRD